MSRIEELAAESGIAQYVAVNNKYLERFANALIDEICDIVLASEQMMSHETQRLIVSDIRSRFT